MSPTDPSPDDVPTKPLPTDVPPGNSMPEMATEPLNAPAPADPVIAPHVPVADVRTAQLSGLAAEPAPRGSGSKLVLIVGLAAAAAAVIAVLALGALQRGGTPVPADTTAPPAAPTTSEEPEEDEGGTVVEPDPEPEPADPAPEEPTPKPEPTEPPPVDPTPAPTEPATGG